MPNQAPTVLIVEDDRHAADVRSIFLNDSGFNTVIAANLREAIEAFEDSAPMDCVITDLNLDPTSPSNADGIGVAKFLKLVRPGTPVIGYSAYFSDDELDDTGVFDAFLPKAASSVEQLAEVVSSLVNAQNLASEIEEGTFEPLSFLCHNSNDKPVVRRLDRALLRKDIQTWFDERDLRPGQPWQEAIEEQIENVASALILVGENGIGPWADLEMRAFLEEFVRRGIPVIPVLLPGCPQQPELPIFLRKFTWVDLRSGLRAAPMAKLIWGITGQKP